MKFSKLFLMAGLVLGVAECGYCQNSPGLAKAVSGFEISISASNFGFSPSTFTVTAGQRVKIYLVNKSGSKHNIAFKLNGKPVMLPENVGANRTGNLEFTAPSKTGDYEFYCPVSIHRHLGMKGKMKVTGNE